MWQDSSAHSGQLLRCSDPIERLYYSSGTFADSNKVYRTQSCFVATKWCCPSAPPVARQAGTGVGGA